MENTPIIRVETKNRPTLLERAKKIGEEILIFAVAIGAGFTKIDKDEE